MKTPFIHKFEVNDSKYIYDINSNEFAEVSQTVFDLIDTNCEKNKLKSLNTNYGILSSYRPECCSSKLETQNIEQIIDRRLRNVCLCVTEKCNLRCSYCIYSGSYTGRRTHSLKDMTFNTAKKAIDYLLEHSSEQKDEISVSFYGGEPLLNFDLIKKSVEYFKQKAGDRKHLFTITTNGIIASEEIIDFLVSNRFYIFVSIDGPEQIHDHNRKRPDGKGTHKDVMEFLKKIKQKDPLFYSYSVSSSTVLTSRSNLIEMDAFFNDLGITTRVSTVESYGYLTENEITEIFSINGYRQLRNKFAKAAINKLFYEDGLKPNPQYSFARSFFYIPMKKIHLRDRSVPKDRCWKALGNCVPGATKLFVSVEGNFYVCEKVDGYENMYIGNVDNGIDPFQVKSIISGSNTMMDECRNCWMVRLCSLCHFGMAHNGKYDINKKRFACKYIRRLYDDMLKLYVYIMERNAEAFRFIEQEEVYYRQEFQNFDEQSFG